MSNPPPLLSNPANRRRILLALAWYSVATHRGVTRYAHDAGWILDGGFARGDQLPQEWEGDGVIAVLGMNAAVDAFVDRLNLPTVNIGYHEHPGIPSIAADADAIGRMAAEHFLARGFRHFAFYFRTHGPGEERHFRGFDRKIREAGHVVHHIDPFAGRPLRGHRAVDVYRTVGRRLAELPKPVAVFAEYDDRAAELVEAALNEGLRVPEQVAVLGSGNDELRCPFAAIPLSSVENDEQRIGYEAARLVDHLVRGGAAPDGPILVPPRGVCVRQSTNILSIPDEDVATALRLIWEHYTEPIDATRVAAQIPLSYPRLHSAFVRHVGHSMSEEITRRRIEHAQRLLADAEMKMADVARLSGFGSADRMGRVFMRKLRTTPSDYQRHAILRQATSDDDPAVTAGSGCGGGVQEAKPALLQQTESPALEGSPSGIDTATDLTTESL